MSPQQLEILQHALGVDEYGRGKMYRNHFCAGGSDEKICRELVEMGYMRIWHGVDPDTGETPGFPYYNCSVTETGKAAVLAESPKPPNLSRSQLRYRRFLNADSDFSFREWLRWDQRAGRNL